MPAPGALPKRIKSIVLQLKRMLTRRTEFKQQSGGGPAGGTAGAAAARPAGSAALLQQQLGRLPPPNPAAAAVVSQLAQKVGTGPPLAQALQQAAAQGRPELLTEYLRQQTAAQLTAQQAAVGSGAGAGTGSLLGKRGAAAAGLPEGGGAPRGAPGGVGGAGGGAAAAAAAAGGGQQALNPESAVRLARSLPVVKRDAAGAPVLPLVLSKDLMVIALGRCAAAEAPAVCGGRQSIALTGCRLHTAAAGLQSEAATGVQSVTSTSRSCCFVWSLACELYMAA